MAKPESRPNFRDIQKSKQKAPILAEAAAAAVITLGAIHFGPGIPKRIDNNTQIDPTAISRIDSLVSTQKLYYPTISEEQLNTRLAYTYFQERDALITLYDSRLDNKIDVETQKTIKRERVVSVLDGVNILKRLSPEANAKISSNNKSIEIKGEEFDLSNNYDLFLADAIIQMQITNSDKNENIVKKYNAGKDLEALLWLKKENPTKINFDDFTMPLPDPEILINTAKFYKQLSELNYGKPAPVNYARYKKNDPGAGWYTWPHERITITNRADAKTIIHEEAHHQADVNSKFGQKQFNETIKQALGKNKLDYWSEEGFINPDVRYKDKTFNSIDRVMDEDYAETIESFFTQGEDFRKNINHLRMTNNPYYEVLKAKYDFAKSFAQGREFVGNMEIFSPKPGDIFTISDPDLDPRAGIALRLAPGHEKRDEDGTIFRGQDAMILEEGVKGVDEFGKEVLFVHVLRGFLVNGGFYNESNPESPKDGWIVADYWLGRKVASAEIQIPLVDKFPGIPGTGPIIIGGN